ncbi:MAG: hypothetical protein HY820_37220 [Acidobacteria bacterium]|nr:hypothetical protein [Acidobacteriota bacterium]
MRDLFVYTADADAVAVVRVVLAKCPLTHKVEPHEGRDSGMIKDGPETIRRKLRKDEYGKAILLWDHHGSGREATPPQKAERNLALRLEYCTWKDRSAAIVVVPELEEWLWQDPRAIERFYGLDSVHLTEAAKQAMNQPKEALVAVHYKVRRKAKLQPADFEKLSTLANHRLWRKCPSFNRFMNTLEMWFPHIKERQ